MNFIVDSPMDLSVEQPAVTWLVPLT